MRNYLIHEDLWSTIDGYNEGDTTSEQVKSRNDKRALAKICLTVDGSAMTHIRSAKSALEAWNALQDAYEDKGMGRRLTLERKLYRLALNDFQNIEMYINAVLSTAQDLADIGKVIEDSSIAAILLGGLTSRYEPLIMALENSNVEVSTELVKRKLLNEMSKIDSTESDAAFQLKNRSTDVHKLKKKKPIVCYECNKPGHKRPDCPLRNKEKKGEGF
ncbi:putative retrovirus-related pol polyprotein from transposon tnt [Operophtera brumata]|uniref:Putative retrovirus-related pol polyprotein from transposon tnt n=1 Tax=Operophtera brumata TaxID=104452 RepID=A0A0L7K8U3_OPEBR|nr:putative retrovirus-related pol polyprotein from transposon tnt [Operophtera brumata]